MGRAIGGAGGYADAVIGNRAPFLWLCGPPGVGMATPAATSGAAGGNRGSEAINT
jgi:hypothetical protein